MVSREGQGLDPGAGEGGSRKLVQVAHTSPTEQQKDLGTLK